jgi:hypothetical protein
MAREEDVEVVKVVLQKNVYGDGDDGGESTVIEEEIENVSLSYSSAKSCLSLVVPIGIPEGPEAGGISPIISPASQSTAMMTSSGVGRDVNISRLKGNWEFSSSLRIILKRSGDGFVREVKETIPVVFQVFDEERHLDVLTPALKEAIHGSALMISPYFHPLCFYSNRHIRSIRSIGDKQYIKWVRKLHKSLR